MQNNKIKEAAEYAKSELERFIDMELNVVSTDTSIGVYMNDEVYFPLYNSNPLDGSQNNENEDIDFSVEWITETSDAFKDFCLMLERKVEVILTGNKITQWEGEE